MTTPMHAPRGFTYPLEPVRQRRQWQLDAQLARLAAQQRKLSESRTALAQMEQGVDRQSALAARFWTERPDPRTQVRMLGYLAMLQQRRLDAERDIAALAKEVDETREQCTRLHQRLEVLDQHRRESVAQHVVEHQRNMASEADRDWLARLPPAPLGRTE